MKPERAGDDMRIGEFLIDIGTQQADWDEELACASCGAPILELHTSGARHEALSIERVTWFDEQPAHADDQIVCPRCGSRSPIARPHLRDLLRTAA